MQVLRSSFTILVAAAILDFCLGDPWGWPHPVQLMGAGIRRYQSISLAWIKSPGGQRLAGVLLGLGLVMGSGGIGAGIVAIATQLSPILGWGVATLLLASCLAGRSLRRAAEEVLGPLRAGNLELARKHLSRYVGRDTDQLSETEVYRAVFETVTENGVDGVLAPLFYGVVGVILGSAFSMGGGGLGVAIALGYKAASTLDSMVGYRELPYTYLGWFSARLEDGLTWLPCRLAVLTIALLSKQPSTVIRLCRRDAPTDPSPNAGWSECAYAAALGVQVGGNNLYHGVIKPKPLLGEDRTPITPKRIHQALALTRSCFLIWLAIAGGILILID